MLREKFHEMEVAQYFPQIKTAQSCINCIRRKYLLILKDCIKVKKSKDLKLSDDMKTITVNGEEQLFVQYDSECQKGNHILIYYSERAVQIIAVST